MARMYTHANQGLINIVPVRMDVKYALMVHMIHETRPQNHQILVMSVTRTIFVSKVINVHVVLVLFPMPRQLNVFHVMVILKILSLASKAIHQLLMESVAPSRNISTKANVKYVLLVLVATKTIEMGLLRFINVPIINTLRTVILIAMIVRLALVFCALMKVVLTVHSVTNALMVTISLHVILVVTALVLDIVFRVRTVTTARTQRIGLSNVHQDI